MPKIKTHKATAKRFRITKKGKITKRKNGQDHFKARETGDLTRSRRQDVSLDNAQDKKNLKSFLPY
jgi:large subunit ribosomal protein L35